MITRRQQQHLAIASALLLFILLVGAALFSPTAQQPPSVPTDQYAIKDVTPETPKPASNKPSDVTIAPSPTSLEPKPAAANPALIVKAEHTPTLYPSPWKYTKEEFVQALKESHVPIEVEKHWAVQFDFGTLQNLKLGDEVTLPLPNGENFVTKIDRISDNASLTSIRGEIVNSGETGTKLRTLFTGSPSFLLATIDLPNGNELLMTVENGVGVMYENTQRNIITDPKKRSSDALEIPTTLDAPRG